MSVALHLAAQAARYQPAPGNGAAPSEIHDNSTSRHSWGICLSPLTDPVENLALSPLSSHFSLSFFFVCVYVVAIGFVF